MSKPPVEEAAEAPEPAGMDAVRELAARWDDSALRELQAYCREKHVPLLLVWMPMLRPEGVRQPDETERFLQARFAALADGKSTWFLNLHDFPLDYAHYYDPTHLNVLGAIRVTEHLGSLLLREPHVALLKAPGSDPAALAEGRAAQP